LINVLVIKLFKPNKIIFSPFQISKIYKYN